VRCLEKGAISALCEYLDGARLVRYREPWLLVWHGGHGINVYGGYSGACVDFFNVGDFAFDSATLEEVEEAMSEYAFDDEEDVDDDVDEDENGED
jgi:hypothetical protein